MTRDGQQTEAQQSLKFLSLNRERKTNFYFVSHFILTVTCKGFSWCIETTNYLDSSTGNKVKQDSLLPKHTVAKANIEILFNNFKIWISHAVFFIHLWLYLFLSVHISLYVFCHIDIFTNHEANRLKPPFSVTSLSTPSFRSLPPRTKLMWQAKLWGCLLNPKAEWTIQTVDDKASWTLVWGKKKQQIKRRKTAK